MSSPNEPRSVSRTYRAAIRLGDDYVTLEETINLPIDASEEEVRQAVALGWQIYQAQREAVEQQLATVREAQASHTPIMVRDPDAPASDKQRNYIAMLQDNLTWSNEQLAGYAAEHTVDLVTMTKGQASGFIDGLKKLADERARYSAESRARTAEAASDSSHAASARQIQALERLAQEQGLELDAETERRFSVPSASLSDEQARLLLSEWQPQRPARAARREATGS